MSTKPAGSAAALAFGGSIVFYTDVVQIQFSLVPDAMTASFGMALA